MNSHRVFMRVLSIGLPLAFSVSVSAAQSTLADQFLPALPGISAEVFQDLGQSACSESSGIPNGTWSSFLCLKFSCVYSGCAAPVIGDHMQGLDATGAFYNIVVRDTAAQDPSWPLGVSGSMQELERRTLAGAEVVLRVPEYRVTCTYNGQQDCVPGCGGGDTRYTTRIFNMTSDPINGVLYVAAWSRKECGSMLIGEGYGIVRISGLPTLLDIILSYQPPSTLSFNVPVRPEGLPGADSFGVYTGNVASAGDLSQAVPLQCTVPAGRAPVPGEHLAVPDTLPDPSPGNGRYYLAAARHGAQIRGGRSMIGGVLQGRNAAAMPSCE